MIATQFVKSNKSHQTLHVNKIDTFYGMQIISQ